jgi:hypothetical protein
MPQYIIFEQNGQIGLCHPNPEHDINWVIAKDCPPGSHIVGEEDIPFIDMPFFDAWRLVDGKVTVDIATAKIVQQNNINFYAKKEAHHRLTNTLSDIANKMPDADWITMLATARINVSASNSTQDLHNAIQPLFDAIESNKG